MKVIDLSKDILTSERYQGDPAPEVEKVFTLENSPFALSILHLPTHAGTHVDGPSHYLPGGGDIDIEKCFGKCVVIKPEPFYIEKALKEGYERILLKGWCDMEEIFDNEKNCPLLIGVEDLSVGSDALHRKLLENGTVILENIDTRKASPGEGMLSALPLKISGLDGSPVRACLLKTDQDKKSVRKKFLAKRDAISEEHRRWKSAMIKKNLFTIESISKARTLFCFMSFRTEVDTKNMISDALIRGQRVAVPKVEGKEMNFYLVTSEKDLEKGAYGIPEPVSGLERVFPERGDAVIFPGAAFDEKGHRIGYGGGFYDRYFQKHPCDVRVAVAFEEQIAIGDIPFEATDKPVTHIVSDRRTVKTVD